MAAAEGRASNTANCADQDFKIPPNSSVSKNLESDLSPNNSVDHIHAKSGGTPHNPNFDRSSDMKRWPHVKKNLGGKANYGCQHLTSFATLCLQAMVPHAATREPLPSTTKQKPAIA